MSSKSKSYEYTLLSPEQGEEGSIKHRNKSRWLSRALRGALYLVIGSSLLLNVFQLMLWLPHKRADVLGDQSVTAYAQLSWNTPGKFEHNGIYDNENSTVTEEAWDSLRYDLGSIALADEYVNSVGLPKAQRFPWDYSKGLYFLNGYHGIHCLKILRLTLKELFEGKNTTTFHQGHSNHCLEALLQDTLCFADDTPRYTAEMHPGRPGDGQQRVCRDWKKLEAFAQTHTSCWRDINPNESIDTLLRYRYCPPGSPYLERIHKIFGDFETGPNANKDN
ncbi:hypothetical protein BDV96DRAFT_599609 [Lophiotrema nucula]|uniref:Tat pathway signal sequence n=1 Tax=Lophiotrema nucula TaxID=690887 RepID=A0A6A5Z7U5_9PLEO|nr:hypothetical protein BDV96DRAFT_599609 [Lophiotrema nucula]